SCLQYHMAMGLRLHLCAPTLTKHIIHVDPRARPHVRQGIPLRYARSSAWLNASAMPNFIEQPMEIVSLMLNAR
ncbi:hypothetical protein PMAYCL1PPCAC_09094, partial [Pristionchus mayeri]